ncbi:hypothetical protein CORC01_11339 [Colletotrichum orchidophilum]|uniref:Uncharacterized protein n=1 Tax=Colletotrichum orchidophilum TaxID=1209926 RepID=A0A1G4AW51_9PEZI|nr:uncharacterized protein CORC01_11339 [Colletotrichum orchidophilum]OHE93389.1 hypothetical protein CORC01_11339 [Colletotrichum orchidophilum]
MTEVINRPATTPAAVVGERAEASLVALVVSGPARQAYSLRRWLGQGDADDPWTPGGVFKTGGGEVAAAAAAAAPGKHPGMCDAGM